MSSLGPLWEPDFQIGPATTDYYLGPFGSLNKRMWDFMAKEKTVVEGR
jgi:hypothetical protein